VDNNLSWYEGVKYISLNNKMSIVVRTYDSDCTCDTKMHKAGVFMIACNKLNLFSSPLTCPRGPQTFSPIEYYGSRKNK
jgi:hypothetical protein